MNWSPSSAIDASLKHWADRLRTHLDVPVLVRWKGERV